MKKLLYKSGTAISLALLSPVALAATRDTREEVQTILFAAKWPRSSSLSIDSRARGPRRPERGRQRDPLGPPAGRRRRFHFSFPSGFAGPAAHET